MGRSCCHRQRRCQVIDCGERVVHLKRNVRLDVDSVERIVRLNVDFERRRNDAELGIDFTANIHAD